MRPTVLVPGSSEGLDPAFAEDLRYYKIVGRSGRSIRIRSATYEPTAKNRFGFFFANRVGLSGPSGIPLIEIDPGIRRVAKPGAVRRLALKQPPVVGLLRPAPELNADFPERKCVDPRTDVSDTISGESEPDGQFASHEIRTRSWPRTAWRSTGLRRLLSNPTTGPCPREIGGHQRFNHDHNEFPSFEEEP
jgi:hypothetical protein